MRDETDWESFAAYEVSRQADRLRQLLGRRRLATKLPEPAKSQ